MYLMNKNRDNRSVAIFFHGEIAYPLGRLEAPSCVPLRNQIVLVILNDLTAALSTCAMVEPIRI
jgi:hypothetical protein